MKKFSLSILFGIISILSIYASVEIEYPVINLTCHYKGADNTIEDNRPRTLVTSPVVYQDNYNLIFVYPGWYNSVTIIDVNTEEIVYEKSIKESAIHITLPTYLEGEYEIRFDCDRYYYSGIIELEK